MMVVRALASLAVALAAGCATPGQYVYNCTGNTITFDGKSIRTRSFDSRATTRTDAKAEFSDGSLQAPIRVTSSQVDSFGHTNTWIAPANVCRQFDKQVVIVDLG